MWQVRHSSNDRLCPQRHWARQGITHHKWCPQFFLDFGQLPPVTAIPAVVSQTIFNPPFSLRTDVIYGWSPRYNTLDSPWEPLVSWQPWTSTPILKAKSRQHTCWHLLLTWSILKDRQTFWGLLQILSRWVSAWNEFIQHRVQVKLEIMVQFNQCINLINSSRIYWRKLDMTSGLLTAGSQINLAGTG